MTERTQDAADASGADFSPPPGHRGVVGIGASAGGLGALEAFFSHVAEDTGLAYVVVVHLSPEHESHLPEILRSHARIPVQQVTDTVLLERDQVYVIPPNANLATVDTHLRLSDLESERGARAPIDHFFRALSHTYKEHAVGVVLTGTGSDGALGIRDIREQGGLTVVQDPTEAEFDGMPRSALATGQIDLVLPVAAMPEAIVQFVHTDPELGDRSAETEPGEIGIRGLQDLFQILLARTGRDFSRYKRPTVLRRVARRMQLQKMEDLDEYLEILRSRNTEAQALADDLLITVTRFFRDSEVFDALEKEIVPGLFEDRDAADEIRAWSVGCATGSEPYSLGILLLDEAERRTEQPLIQIFATDLHEPSLQLARAGRYDREIEKDVGAPRLARYFLEENGGYRVGSQVRDLVVFSHHNLLGDPPFSHLDMVVCRNLLIYLQSDAQQQVMELFHYALKPDGILVLGTSESVGHSDLFRPVDKQHHIYRRQNVPGPEPRLPVFSLGRRAMSMGAAPHRPPRPPRRYGVVHQHMLERYGPPTLLIDPSDQVVHLSDRAARFLSQPGGDLTTSATKLVREELRLALMSAMRAVRKEGKSVRTEAVPVRLDGRTVKVTMDVRPSTNPEEYGFVLVAFEAHGKADGPKTGAQDRGHPEPGSEDASDMTEVEEELERTRVRLRTVVYDAEKSREEMQASNEELQSMNEELRSTLEELETSKEELQSLNEELQTVNQENRHKVEELAELSGDLQNLLVATDIATLFLDRDLRILRFTPRLGRLFNVKEGDRGRPISDLTHRLNYEELVADGEQVLDRLEIIEREVRDGDGRWYMTRVMPYRSPKDRIEGVVLTFIDITNRKEMERALRESKAFMENIVQTLHEPLLVLTADLSVHTANRAFYETFGREPETTLGRSLYSLGNGEWDVPEIRALLDDVLEEDNELRAAEAVLELTEKGDRTLVMHGKHLEGVSLILLGIRDVTRERALAERLRQSQKMEAVGRLAGGVAHDFNNLLTAVEGHATLLLDQIPEDSPLRMDVEQIHGAGRRAAHLTDQLLAFSREQVQQPRIVALGRVTLGMEKLLRRLVPERIDLSMVVPGVDPVARADPGHLEQVVLNLVVNASEATEDIGTIFVTVDTREVSAEEAATLPWQVEPGPFARLTVRDQGRGIDPSLIDRIFEPFVSSKDTATGAGLGLATVYGIVKQSGGHILVHSTPNEGTEFEVLLPRVFEEPEPSKAPVSTDRVSDGPRDEDAILLVEDDLSVRRIVRRMLEQAGYAVIEAGNGLEALDRLGDESAPVSLVISDVVMPKLGGIELAQRIGDAHPDLPVILVSGYAQEDMRNQIAEVATAFIPKPFTRAALLDCIARVLVDAK